VRSLARLEEVLEHKLNRLLRLLALTQERL
jgi:hypothetical protein